MEEKINEAVRKTNEIMEESYVSVVNKVEDNKKVTMSQPPKERIISLSRNIEISFRVKVIPEDPDKTRDQSFVPTIEHVTHILITIGVEAEIVNLRRLGKFQRERAKPRAVLITLPSATAVNLVMNKIAERQPELKDMKVFVSRALSIEDSRKENICLKRRKEHLEQVVERDQLKIRNLTLHNDRIEVPLNDTPNIQTKTWLSHIQILQFNARSLLDRQRRFRMTNAISFGSYHVICICNIWLNLGILDSELLLNDCTIYWSDREHRNINLHSGSLIAVKKYLSSENIKVDVECCTICKIRLISKDIYICSFENPPQNSQYKYDVDCYHRIL